MDVSPALTHDCNLGCGYCYTGAKFRKRMSREIADKGLALAFGPNRAGERRARCSSRTSAASRCSNSSS